MGSEIYDGKVTLKIKGQKQIQWEYPTEQELQTIADFVAEALRSGSKIEHFEIERFLKIL